MSELTARHTEGPREDCEKCSNAGGHFKTARQGKRRGLTVKVSVGKMENKSPIF